MKTNLTKFAAICVKKRQKARFLSPRSSKIIVTKKKERLEGKEEKKKKTMVALLVFIIAALEKVFGRQKLLDAKGPSGDNVIKKGVDIVLTQ